MKKVAVGLTLRDRLGENGVRDLDDYIAEHRDAWREDVVNGVTERLEYRFQDCASREDMIDGFARVGSRIDATKVEILRWSFAFWIGGVAAIGGLLVYIVK